MSEYLLRVLFVKIVLHCTLICCSHTLSYFGTGNLTEYRPGNVNLILSSPHGGAVEPTELPKRRQAGCYDNSKKKCIYTYDCSPMDTERCKTGLPNDPGTNELLLLLADEIEALTSNKPHLVIGHVHRNRVDLNRGPREGTFGHPEALKVHTEFFQFLDRAVSAIKGPGLLLDIHAHPHPEPWVELGYLLDAEWLNKVAADPISHNTCSRSNSFMSLINRQCGTIPSNSSCCNDLISGSSSFGSMLADAGTGPQYDIVPSSKIPSPGNGTYFAGGYLISRFSTAGGTGYLESDAVGIETPRAITVNATRREPYVKVLARATVSFHKKYYTSSVADILKPCYIYVYMSIIWAVYNLSGKY